MAPLRRQARSDQCSHVEFTSDATGSADDRLAGYETLPRREPTLAVFFAGPFDSFCRRLDASLIERGWRAASDVLDTFDVDPGECRWGWVHPGLMVRASNEVDNPIAGFGWLLPQHHLRHVGLTSDVDATWREALQQTDERFRGCDPSLTVAISEPRSFEYVGAVPNRTARCVGLACTRGRWAWGMVGHCPSDVASRRRADGQRLGGGRSQLHTRRRRTRCARVR